MPGPVGAAASAGGGEVARLVPNLGAPPASQPGKLRGHPPARHFAECCPKPNPDRRRAYTIDVFAPSYEGFETVKWAALGFSPGQVGFGGGGVVRGRIISFKKVVAPAFLAFWAS